jgi:hypothetical protein
MPLPFIIAGAALIAGAYGAKKGVDGYKTHSEADEIIESTKNKYNSQKNKFDTQEKKTQSSLEQLGGLELDIGASFGEFSTLADALLEKLNSGRQNKLSINLPRHRLEKIESYKFTALGVLGSVAGSGVAGVAAGFAVYGGVMTFAAASTGTAISALSGAAATNATLAAIGGGAISAGGLGMAGGTAILGAAVAAPVLAIAGWAYANHGEEALENARKARREANAAIDKLIIAAENLAKTEVYALKIRSSITSIYSDFQKYFNQLKAISRRIDDCKELGLNPSDEINNLSPRIICTIENGYAMAAILTDIITTPLFKFKTNGDELIKDKNGIPVMAKDADGSLVINSESIDNAITQGDRDMQKFSPA